MEGTPSACSFSQSSNMASPTTRGIVPQCRGGFRGATLPTRTGRSWRFGTSEGHPQPAPDQGYLRCCCQWSTSARAGWGRSILAMPHPRPDRACKATPQAKPAPTTVRGQWDCQGILRRREAIGLSGHLAMMERQWYPPSEHLSLRVALHVDHRSPDRHPNTLRLQGHDDSGPGAGS